jgi:hypothetical protein
MINTKGSSNTDARIEKERKLLRHLPSEYKFSLITGCALGTLLKVSIQAINKGNSFHDV